MGGHALWKQARQIIARADHDGPSLDDPTCCDHPPRLDFQNCGHPLEGDAESLLKIGGEVRNGMPGAATLSSWGLRRPQVTGGGKLRPRRRQGL